MNHRAHAASPDASFGARAPVAPRSAPRSAPRRPAAIACLLDDRLVAIDARSIEAIVEYDVTPMPGAREPVRGIALVRGKLVVSLGFGGRVGLASRRTRAVLLRAPRLRGRWAIEVAQVRALGGDADTIPWLDVRRLVAQAEAFFDEARA